MKSIYYALYSIPTVCLLGLCLTYPAIALEPLGPGPQFALLATMTVAIPILTMGGLMAIGEAFCKGYPKRRLVIMTVCAFLPGLMASTLVGSLSDCLERMPK